MKQVQFPCCMGGVRVTVKNKWTNMSKNKRNFIITELLLGVLLVIGIGFIAYNKLNEKPERIAVVMADVDESHSAAFKYGMKMAASEYGVDVVMISKENLNNMSDEIDVIKQEINKKADAVVFKPTAEKMTEEKSLNTLIRINKKTPIMVVGDQAGSESFKSLNTVEFDQYSMGAKLAQKLLADNNGTLSGKKIYGNSSSYDIIAYKLYDSKGYLIDSSNLYLKSLSTGDKFKDDSIVVYDITPGENYTLQFTEYNW